MLKSITLLQEKVTSFTPFLVRSVQSMTWWINRTKHRRNIQRELNGVRVCYERECSCNTLKLGLMGSGTINI